MKKLVKDKKPKQFQYLPTIFRERNQKNFNGNIKSIVKNCCQFISELSTKITYITIKHSNYNGNNTIYRINRSGTNSNTLHQQGIAIATNLMEGKCLHNSGDLQICFHYYHNLHAYHNINHSHLLVVWLWQYLAEDPKQLPTQFQVEACI